MIGSGLLCLDTLDDDDESEDDKRMRHPRNRTRSTL